MRCNKTLGNKMKRYSLQISDNSSKICHVTSVELRLTKAEISFFLSLEDGTFG